LRTELVPFEEFEPSSRIHDPKQLAVWKVDAKVGQTHFRALYRGKLLDEAFNEGWAGKTLAEITPPSLHKEAKAGHEDLTLRAGLTADAAPSLPGETVCRRSEIRLPLDVAPARLPRNLR
jgi:hypothetical protein